MGGGGPSFSSPAPAPAAIPAPSVPDKQVITATEKEINSRKSKKAITPFVVGTISDQPLGSNTLLGG